MLLICKFYLPRVFLFSCYSPNPTHRQGTFDATLCYMQDHNLTRYASQVILSSPHFLNGDPTLTQQISGLAPNEYEHGFYIDVHAVSQHSLSLSQVQQCFLIRPITGNFIGDLHSSDYFD